MKLIHRAIKRLNASLNVQRTKLKIQVNDIVIIDIGLDVTIISPTSWHPEWLLQKVNIQLPGVGTLPLVKELKKRTRWVKCIGPIG